MRKKQKSKRLIMALALILLVTISIGYAALSTELRINGTANIAATSWNVHFENVNVTSTNVTGNTAAVTEAPTVAENNTTTTQLTYNVTLNKPGDFYEFTVDVVNGGTVNAKIADNGITKTAKIGGSDLSEAQAKLVNYTVTYADAGNTAVAVGDKLAKNGTTGQDTKTLKVRVEYNTDITPAELNAVNGDMALSLTFGLVYEQD